MVKKEPNTVSLVISIITLIIGIILCFNDSSSIFAIIGYFVSGLLITSGIIKLIITHITNKRLSEINYSGILSSVALLALGVVVALFPQSIMITISLCIGSLIIFSGIQRLILGVIVKKIDSKGSLFYTLESILIIILGIIILTQRFTNLLGVFLIIYSISELVGYIFYVVQDKDYSEVLNKKITKEMKESKAVDAIIEEDENE